MNRNKNTKPAYIVDITDATNIEDMKAAFALGKHNAGIPLTDDELKTIIQYTIKMVPTVCICDVKVYDVVEKKKPWYKRFWNWITRKNK